MSRAPLPSGAEMWRKTMPIKPVVKWLLQYRPGTRGNDALLQWYVWMYHDHVRIDRGLTIDILTGRAGPRLTSAETIRRRRQEVQRENPELKPTERTQKKRLARELAFRHAYGKGAPTIADWLPPEEIELED